MAFPIQFILIPFFGFLIGYGYQALGKDLVFVLAGIGRELQPVHDFPYSCRRLTDSRLHACEDMWLDDSSRQLFLACSDSLSRKDWQPTVGHLNASGRGLDDHITVLEIDQPTNDSFQLRTLSTPGYSGINGDGRLHVVGMHGVRTLDDVIRLYLVNARPSVDSITGQLLDNTVVGPNNTIELFELNPTDTSAKHVKTFAHPQINTPNRIAARSDGSFFFTNDHGPHTVGLRHTLAPTVGNGDVSICTGSDCKLLKTGFKFPNGLALGNDGLLYVPTINTGIIHVFSILPDNSIKEVDKIEIGYPIDNLSVDPKGDIYAATLPKAMETIGAFKDPLGATPPSTAFRISKTSEGYKVEKVIEDAKGEVLPGATTALHDAKTGRLFLSGILSPFITVCDPK